jgi:hypothetical protein
MHTVRNTYKHITAKVKRKKKNASDKLGLHAQRSASPPRESLTGDRASSEGPSSHPRASIGETTVERDAISRDNTSPIDTVHRPISQLPVESVGLDRETSEPQSSWDATRCE